MSGFPRQGPRVLIGLSALFAIEFAVFGFNPADRSTWILENVLVVVVVVALALSYHVFRFSRFSYFLIFAFLSLHEIGSHYTYSLVPYDEWGRALTGLSLDEALGFKRNQFDRGIHFAYGLLLAYPIREIFLRVVDVRGFWGYFLPLDLTMSSSMLYELIEWGAAVTFGGDLGHHYLGSQGDPWDAHKDMALASLGALVAMSLSATVNRIRQRDFAAEWARSLDVKQPDPLDEFD